MIKVYCCKCKKELKKPGGLLFAPPVESEHIQTVSKWHLCKKCYYEVEKFVNVYFGEQYEGK